MTLQKSSILGCVTECLMGGDITHLITLVLVLTKHFLAQTQLRGVRKRGAQPCRMCSLFSYDLCFFARTFFFFLWPKWFGLKKLRGMLFPKICFKNRGFTIKSKCGIHGEIFIKLFM